MDKDSEGDSHGPF